MNPTIVVGALGDDPTEARLFYGKNVLDALRLLPDESINMVATSPPYWALRDYGVGHQVWGGDPECDHEWGDEIAGRSQSGGTGASTLGAASGGNSISPEGVQRSLERSHAAPKRSSFCSKCWAWRGCLGLEPTPNLFVKHLVLIGREIRRVLHPSGTFWLNLGDSYMSHSASAGAQVGGFEGERQKQEDGYREAAIIGKPSKVPGLKDKDLVGVPWRAALALQADGWWLRNDIIWHKANAMPSSVRDRFSCKYEHVFMFAKQARYFFDLDAVKVPHTSGTYDEEGNFEPNQQWFESGEGQRKMDQTDGQLGHLAASPRRVGRGLFDAAGKNPGDVWKLSTGGYKGAHFAVWPRHLVERFIRAGSSEHGRCVACKAPWKRLTEKVGDIPMTDRRRNLAQYATSDVRLSQDGGGTAHSTLGAGAGGDVPLRKTVTVGWAPTCGCDTQEVEPCVVLDTFSGSGTTGEVAMKLGRNYVGLDLNHEYLPLAQARLEGRKAPTEDDEPDLIGELFG